MSQTEVNYQKKELPAKLGKVGLVLLVVGVLLGIIAFLLSIPQERVLTISFHIRFSSVLVLVRFF